MSAHHIGDLIYWFIFFLGECLWVLVCAAAAIRSVHNPIKNRRQYVAQNWDIFLIRFAVSMIFFVLWRHVAMNTILQYIHIPFSLPAEAGGPGAGGPVAAFFLGLGSDTLINATSHWNGLPKQIQQFIQERIPDLPQQVIASVETTTRITPTDQNQMTTQVQSTQEVKAPIEPKP